MPLLPVAHPAITLDLRYATADNITGRAIYDRAVALLHPDAHAALLRAAELAQARQLRLHVFDAYRPVAAQWRLWQTLPDPNFVADPRKGSLHNRGIAVDLTLASADGSLLDMGTGFDDMTPQSSHGRADIAAAQRNRSLLLGIMAAAGWLHHPREWWHYNLRPTDAHPMIDDAAEGRLLMDRPDQLDG